MYFPELEEYSGKYPSLGSLLSSLDKYLANLMADKTPRHIVPALVAKSLSIDEGLALVILMLVHEAKLIEPQYMVYCSDTENFLGSYLSLKDVPDKVFCPYHDKEHDSHEYYVELTFKFTAKALNKYAQVTS